MFFSSIKEINRLLKEINGLLSKGMSNIYLEVTIEKKWHTVLCLVVGVGYIPFLHKFDQLFQFIRFLFYKSLT